MVDKTMRAVSRNQYRNIFPANHVDLTWRHPAVHPNTDEMMMCVFFGVDDEGVFVYRYTETYFDMDDMQWMIPDDLEEDEEVDHYEFLAWMPFPEPPGAPNET